jgi:hypothetical protein
MFLYRGRAEMLAVLTVLSLGNTQWDASTSQLLVTVSSQPVAAATALAHRTTNRRGRRSRASHRRCRYRYAAATAPFVDRRPPRASFLRRDQLGACLLCAASAGLSLYVLDRQPELDRVMTEQLEIAVRRPSPLPSFLAPTAHY